jgi:hypothetical protein
VGYEPLHDRFRYDRTVLHEGVPEWMHGDFMTLLRQLMDSDDNLPGVVQQTLRLTVDKEHRQHVLLSHASADPELALEMLHLCLTRTPNQGAGGSRRQASASLAIAELLQRCQSAWAVGIQEGHYGLQRRVDPTVYAAAEVAMDAPTTAAAHLRDAWTACYQRNADPDQAMRKTVFALEAALASVVTEGDPQPSLGKISAAMRDAPHKWTVPLDDTRPRGSDDGVPAAATLARQLEHVWRTHRRHIDRDGKASGNTMAEAESALHVAVHIVHLAQRGLLASS